MKSAVDRLQAIGMLYTTATLNNAFTSTSWGWDDMGSQRKIIKSISPFAIKEPICKSPPIGPDFKRLTRKFWMDFCISSSTRLPVVPVQTRLNWLRVWQLKETHWMRSLFLLSWATSAIVFFTTKMR